MNKYIDVGNQRQHCEKREEKKWNGKVRKKKSSNVGLELEVSECRLIN
jgi:hypothetical protein